MTNNLTMPSATDILLKYFPGLTKKQQDRFSKLEALYRYWNARVNVISRKDIDLLYERHVLHSLGIAKVIDFKPGTRVLDVGTGGGFPGIPLAIIFEDSSFLLVDAVAKKIKVVNEIVRELDLKNTDAEQIRAEKVKGKFDFVVSRAVTKMPGFLNWINGKFRPENKNELHNGVLYLKGGELEDEMKDVKQSYRIYPLSEHFEEPFFETKKVVYVRMV